MIWCQALWQRRRQSPAVSGESLSTLSLPLALSQRIRIRAKLVAGSEELMAHTHTDTVTHAVWMGDSGCKWCSCSRFAEKSEKIYLKNTDGVRRATRQQAQENGTGTGKVTIGTGYRYRTPRLPAELANALGAALFACPLRAQFNSDLYVSIVCLRRL